MSVKENMRDRASKNNADEVLKVQNLRESMSTIKHKFLVMSSQGGVGKTSVIVNLALALSKRGVKVGLMDVNFRAPDVYRMLGLKSTVASNRDERFMPVPYSDDLKVASIEPVMQDEDESGVWEKSLNISDIRRFISSVNWGNLDYLFVDTPSGPGEALLDMIRSIPEAKTIIVTAPNKISRDRAEKMIKFFRKENIPIFGWIENMRGFFCRHCGKAQEMLSTGSSGRAIFLGDIPFLGRIPIDPHLVECADAENPFLEKYPKSETAKACNAIIEKIMDGSKTGLQ